MDLYIEGTVTDIKEYKPADSNTVYKTLEVSGANVGLPQAWSGQLPTLGQAVRCKVFLSGSNKFRLVGLETPQKRVIP